MSEPKNDPWVQRIPGKDEKSEDGQVYARNDSSEGTHYFNGTMDQGADAVLWPQGEADHGSDGQDNDNTYKYG